ncbi:MAG: hypothetical protein ACI920_003548, partial [Saprospiraceae bacterium]
TISGIKASCCSFVKTSSTSPLIGGADFTVSTGDIFVVFPDRRR